MIAKDRMNAGLTLLDSLTALAISYLVVTAPHRSIAEFLHPGTLDIRALDAAFGVIFAFGWQYCFTVLFVDDKLASLPSRLINAFQGVSLMTAPVVLELFVFHQRSASLRTVFFLLASLFAYEVICMTLGSYLLDRMSARNPRRAIILGSGRRATKAWKEIRTRYHSSITLLGFVDDRLPDEMPPDLASRYCGTVDQLEKVLLEEVVDILLVAMPNKSCYGLIQRAITVAETSGVPVIYLQDTYALSNRRNQPAGIFSELAPNHNRYLFRRAVKRALDIFGALVGIVLFSPLLLAIAVVIRLTTTESILIRDDRYGYRRRLFRVLKFRCVKGSQFGPSVRYLEAARKAGGPIFNRTNDPSLTTFGRFLRKTSLEDLPELWNVLVGEMSLVGPRPMSERDLSVFAEKTLMRRFSVLPGMTGLWQVNGRTGVTFDEWTDMDSRYIDKWSLALDLRILLRTFSAIISRSKAVQG